MSTSGEGVDVLAQLDAAILLCRRDLPARHRELIATKAIIAELIEATDAMQNCVWVEHECTRRAVERLRAALAACRATPDPPA